MSRLSRKSSQCRSVSETVEKAALKMGAVKITRDAAGWSASQYIYVHVNDDDYFKVRISDHDNPRGNDGDVFIFVYDNENDTRESLIRGIENLAFKMNALVPDYYSRTAFEARSSSAKASSIKAVRARAQNQADIEAEMTDEVFKKLLPTGYADCFSASVAFEQLYDGQAKAQIKRVARAASDRVKDELKAQGKKPLRLPTGYPDDKEKIILSALKAA